MKTDSKSKQEERLWTKNYVTVLVVSLLIGSAISMLMSTISLYAKHLGAVNAVSGLVVGVYAYTSLLCRPLVGSLLDRHGRKPVLVGGVIILSAIFLMYNFSYTVIFLLWLRVIQGIGFSAYNTAVNTAAADIVPRSRLSEGIGYFSITLTLPTAFGPSLGLYIIDRSGYSLLFLIAFLLVLCGLIASLFIKNTGKPQVPAVKQKLSFDSFFEKKALGESLVMFFIALGLGGIITFLPYFGQERGIAGIGSYFTVYAIFLIISRLFSGKIADKIGMTVVVVPGTLSVMLSFIILSFSKTLLPCLVSAAFFGLGYGILLPVMNAAVIRKCDASRKGVANSTFTAAMDIGMGTGSIVWGAISQRFGFLPVYMLCACCAVISLLTYICIRQNFSQNNSNVQGD